MTSISPPPLFSEVVDEDNKLTLPFNLYMNQLYVGDTGTSWTPTFVNLASTGTPTFTGRYYRLSSKLCYFRVVITPVTDTTATAGSTYIDNFPLTIGADGACHAVEGNLGSNAGMVVKAGNRIYVPGWAAVAVPVTITGTVEIA